MPRLTTRPAEIGWDVIIGHLLLVQHWQNAPANVRLQAAEIFDKIVSAAPKESPDIPEEQQRRTQDQVFQALLRQAEPQDHMQISTDVEIRQAALDTLYKILESQGHALTCGWIPIFSILQTACPQQRSLEPVSGSSLETSAATAAKTSQLVRVAFPSLQLICSDFLAALSVEESGMCISTLAAFGHQVEDVNVALTVSEGGQLEHSIFTDVLVGTQGWQSSVASLRPFTSCSTTVESGGRVPQIMATAPAQLAWTLSRPAI